MATKKILKIVKTSNLTKMGIFSSGCKNIRRCFVIKFLLTINFSKLSKFTILSSIVGGLFELLFKLKSVKIKKKNEWGLFGGKFGKIA